jgi:hypothetical protein
MLGSAILGPAGSALGAAAGSLLATITGHGDYTVKSNTVLSGAPPTFRSGSDGMRVCHREYLLDVTGSVGWSNAVNLYINPGDSACFPWLSSIAQGFEEYTLHGLVFEYRPTSGTAITSTSAALGSVIMATNYDVLDPIFASKQEMEAYEFSSQTVPYNGVLHAVECAASTRPFNVQFVRNGTPPEGSDRRLFDLGLFQLATVGMQSAGVVGELWVSYDVSLRKPRISPYSSAGLNDVEYALVRSAGATATALLPLGGPPVAEAHTNLSGFSVISGSSFVIGLPGSYLIVYNAAGSGMTGATVLGLPATAGVSALPLWQGAAGAPTGTFSQSSPSGGSTVGVWLVSIQYAATNIFSITGPTGLAGGYSSLTVVPIPSF